MNLNCLKFKLKFKDTSNMTKRENFLMLGH